MVGDVGELKSLEAAEEFFFFFNNPPNVGMSSLRGFQTTDESETATWRYDKGQLSGGSDLRPQRHRCRNGGYVITSGAGRGSSVSGPGVADRSASDENWSVRRLTVWRCCRPGIDEVRERGRS